MRAASRTDASGGEEASVAGGRLPPWPASRAGPLVPASSFAGGDGTPVSTAASATRRVASAESDEQAVSTADKPRTVDVQTPERGKTIMEIQQF
jgi:hypothetical protein